MTSAFYQGIHMEPGVVHTLLTDWDDVVEVARQLIPVSRLFLVGLGTSFHAALVGKYLFRCGGIDTHALQAVDFVTYPPFLQKNDAVFVLSATADNHSWTNRAIQVAMATNALTIGITCQQSKMSETNIVIRTVEQELSPACSISYIGALTRMAQIASKLALFRSYKTEAQKIEQDLMYLPLLMEEILMREELLRDVAQDVITNQRRVYLIGTGTNMISALEGALKIKETSYITTEGFELEQCIQGPYIAFDKNDLIIPISLSGLMQSRMKDFLFALNKIETRVLFVGNLPDPSIQELFFQQGWKHFNLGLTTDIHDALAPFLTVLPLQLFADLLATASGTDADGFRDDEEQYAQANNYLFK